MLLSYLLEKQKANFHFLGNSDENIDFIAKQLTEFKKHKISLEQLKEIEKEMQNRYLQEKLKDLITIYEQYTTKIQNEYIDENDGLTILGEKLSFSKTFLNSHIYIDEFAGFTMQEYEIMRSLLKQANQVTITICTDNLQMDTNADIDIFYANKQTAFKLMKIAQEENITIETAVNVEKVNGNIPRFQTEELQHLAINFPLTTYQKYEKEVKNISLFLANNPYSEVEYVATEIVKLVKNENYCYKDIAVITKNLEIYASLCKSIFKEYQIPVFIDEKKELGQNLLIQYVLAILDVFAKNWSYEVVFHYLKTGFSDLEKNQIAILENYCLKWGIKGSHWLKSEWNFYDESEEEKNTIIYAKQVVAEPLKKFKQELSGRKTVKEITQSLYTFLVKNRIPEKMQAKVQNYENKEEIQQEYETSFKIMTEVLDEIVLVLGDTFISFEQYSKLLKMGFKNSDLGTIPGTLDQVNVGDVDRSRSHQVQAVFIVGVNDGSFPTIYKEEGFLNDKDREQLKEQGIELAKGTLERLYDDNFNIYKAVTTPEKKLYLSYDSSDTEGHSLRPSIVINKIKRIFPNVIETSDVITKTSEILLENVTFDELLVQLQKLQQGEKIEPIWFSVYRYYQIHEKEKLERTIKALFYQNQPEEIEKKNSQQLYGDTLKTSVSRLEQYQSCPFSYYLKYGLKLKEQTTFQIEAINTGNFMHEVIDSFFEKIQEKGIKVKEITQEQMQIVIQEIIQEKLALPKYYIFGAIPKYKVLAKRLENVLIKSMKYIVDSLKYSDFELMGHEIEFGNGKQFEAITIELKDGKKVEITGKIDRVDIAKTAKGEYIRIIDYKSSAKNISLGEVIAGIQLQLLTYLDATCAQEETNMPAGAFYFHLMDSIVNMSAHLTEEQLEQEIRKQFKMQGLLLADVEVVKKMDNTLETGNSNIIPAYINKEGEISEKPNTLTRRQFEDLEKYVQKMIRKIAEKMLDGNIAITPYYQVKNKKKPCDYCSFAAICQFNQTTKNAYQYIPNYSKEEVLEILSHGDVS